MNEQSYKSLVLRKFHTFSRNQTPIIAYLSCVVDKDKQKKRRPNKYPVAFLDTLKAQSRTSSKKVIALTDFWLKSLIRLNDFLLR